MQKTNLLVVVIAFILVVYSSIFTVDQRLYAVVFQFGEAVRIIDKPGLKAKIPFIQKVEFYDKRLLNVEVEAKELTASDGKRIIVDAFARFKIIDPVIFYRTVNNYQNITIRLNKIIESAMRKVIGKSPLTTLLSFERGNIMKDIYDSVDVEAKNFGVKISDVKIMRADLPKENSVAIYKRMQTEREKEARQIRAEGQEEAMKIRSIADKEIRILMAEAYMKSQILKGEGDAISSKTYNNTYSKDPEFYSFYKSLDAYKKSLKDNTYIIISPNSGFLKYLNFGK
jgi:modulator of FtsH protease HflC